MSILTAFAQTKPAKQANENYFRDGRGRAIVKAIKFFKGQSDPQTMVFEFVIKSSSSIPGGGTPNAVGETVSFTKKFTTIQGDAARAMAVFTALFGPDAPKGEKELEAEIASVISADETGYSKDGATTPARGMEVAFETKRVTTKKGESITVPVFSHVPFDEAAVLENRAILDGAKSA